MQRFQITNRGVEVGVFPIPRNPVKCVRKGFAVSAAINSELWNKAEVASLKTDKKNFNGI
jgi:hypothetical protein